MAVAGVPVNSVLVTLRDHLKAQAVMVRTPDAPPPDGSRLAIIPLHHRERYLGDLVADAPEDQDGAAFASALAFFAPVVALALAAGSGAALAEPPLALADSIHEEHDRLEAVLESTNDAILIIDTAGRVVTVTLLFETFTGIPRYDILGHASEHLLQRIQAMPGLPAQMVNMFASLVDNFAESLGGEFEVTEPKRRVLVWYSLPVYAQTGALMGRIFVFRDATRERELDRMKTEFISLVSHELRTPLTSVRGFIELILDADLRGLDPQVREYLDIIAQNANRLATLLNDILDVTRIETDRVELNPRLCPLQDVIQQVAAEMQPLLSKNQHTLRLDVEPNLPPVWADQVRMAQILTNLFTNAIKYTPDPGTITVRARHVRQADHLPPQASRNQILPCVMVSVQDTGIGISDEDQARLFSRFYRANTKTGQLVGGTGLGLSIVKAFVEMHGGQVWVDSALDSGATFYFTIPIVESKSPRY